MERLEIKMIRLWPILIAATVFLSSCATTPVEEIATPTATVSTDKCPMKLTMKEWVTDVLDRNPLIPTKHSVLKGDKVTVFMAAFNATPPESNYDPDTIVIFVAPTDPRAVVGFVKDECMISAYAYPLGVVSSWVNGKPVFLQPQSPSSNKGGV